MTDLDNVDAFFSAVRTFNYKQWMLDVIAGAPQRRKLKAPHPDASGAIR